MDSLPFNAPSFLTNPFQTPAIFSSSTFQSISPSTRTMKFTKFIPGKNLFRSRKSRSISSRTTSSSSLSLDGSKNPNGSSTPTSVIPEASFDLRLAFEMIDRDGDGKITTEDLDRLLRRIGGGEADLKSMLRAVDRDGDGCISLEEFGAIGPAFAPPSCDGEMREAFDFFDSDRDGRITAEELFGVFGTIGGDGCTLDECRRMIRGVDRSGDGFVCFADFSRMMEAQ